MQKSQKGFTLIELVVVIVLLGILGVTALAKYQDLSEQAAGAANSGIASEMSAAAAINYAANISGVTTAIDIDSTTDTCDTADIGGLLASGSLPTGHLYTRSGAVCAASGDTYTCTVTDTTYTSASSGAATIICTGG